MISAKAKKVRHTYLKKDLRGQKEIFRKQMLTSLVVCSATAKKGQVKVVSWHSVSFIDLRRVNIFVCPLF